MEGKIRPVTYLEEGQAGSGTLLGKYLPRLKMDGCATKAGGHAWRGSLAISGRGGWDFPYSDALAVPIFPLGR